MFSANIRDGSFSEDILVAVLMRIFEWQFWWGYPGGSFSEDIWVAVFVWIFWVAVLVGMFGWQFW